MVEGAVSKLSELAEKDHVVWGEMFLEHHGRWCQSIRCKRTRWEQAVESSELRAEIADMVRHGLVLPTKPFNITSCDRPKKQNQLADWPVGDPQKRSGCLPCKQVTVPLGKNAQDAKLVPRRYSLLGTTSLQFGEIGGAGLRVYFDTLKNFAQVFAVCTALTMICILFNSSNLDTEAIDSLTAAAIQAVATVNGSTNTETTAAINATLFMGQGLYDTPRAIRGVNFGSEIYKGIVTTTLGNIYATDEDIENGQVPALWVTSCIDVIITFLLLFLSIAARKKLNAVSEETDINTVTMGDYSVLITPVGFCHGAGAEGKWEFGGRHWPAIKLALEEFVSQAVSLT
eukprot:SAG31_NODE_8806_length_1384_cov_1.418677_2_plen_342_part_01